MGALQHRQDVWLTTGLDVHTAAAAAAPIQGDVREVLVSINGPSRLPQLQASVRSRIAGPGGPHAGQRAVPQLDTAPVCSFATSCHARQSGRVQAVSLGQRAGAALAGATGKTLAAEWTKSKE